MSKVLGSAFGWIGIALTLVSTFVSLRKQKELSKKGSLIHIVTAHYKQA